MAASLSFLSHLKPYPCSPQLLPSSYPSPKPSSFISFSLARPTSSSTSSSSTHQLPPDFTPRQLLEALRKQNDPEMALWVFDWASQQPNFKPTLSVYEEVLRMLGNEGSFDSMERVLREMKQSGCEINEGDIKKAADIVQTMTSNGCEPDIVTYGTLIQGLCKAGRVEVATRLLRSIQMKGMVLTPHAYNPVIQALFKKGRSDEAVRLFREMAEKGGPPDFVSHKIVFRGLCSSSGPIGEAVDFLVEMLENGFLPESLSFMMLADGLCSLSMEGTLIKLIDMIMKQGRFSESEVSVIKGFLKIRKFQDALATLVSMLNSRNPRRNYR
uniref:Pentacotripeptide-repeat region of PRORP domain-containing protein n=1 Tax=Opuntia streptacantha TaxID=393608 RepID=A0A7C9EX18_OPUST